MTVYWSFVHVFVVCLVQVPRVTLGLKRAIVTGAAVLSLWESHP